jgi:hypothetical protein
MRYLLILPWLAAACPALAAQQDEQLWTQTNVHVPLGDGWRLTGEAIVRWGDQQGGVIQTEFGALLSRKLSSHIELGAGYRRVAIHSGPAITVEDRIRQQIVGTFGHVTTRLRIDERFHPAGDEIGFRIRPLIRLTEPVGKHGFAWFVSHESFFLPNSTAWGQRAGYERMRNSIGVVLPLAKQFSSDVGYLNQYRFARGGAPARSDSALSIQLTYSFAAHKAPHSED